MEWSLLDKTTVLESPPFSIQALSLYDTKANREFDHKFYRLACPDWVNVLPITPDGQAVLIRQPRVGSMSSVLETPGGVVDAHEKDPTLTAARELEEETGYRFQRILSLGSVNPNPAIMNNRVHMFLALGCFSAGESRRLFPDELERIQVELTPVNELENLIRHGRIDHALACLTIFYAGKYLATYKK